MLSKKLRVWLIGLSLILTGGGANAQETTISQDNPEVMIAQLSETVMNALNEQREELEGNPQKIKAFAQHYVLPYVDTPKMARYVMGRYWRTTTQEQQNAFVEEFTTTLLRSYSQSLLKLKITQVAVKPQVEEKPGRVTVPSEVTQADGNKTDVIYRAYLDKKQNKWMVYDVTVEGVSMLLSYRKTYDSEFSKVGVDQVIATMKEKNKEFNGA
ncbi:ABC transporter substrate-binding protein [Thiomicrorhabdus sp. zzn3]|uniref:MlaC/ttg2D family ABC transporter substrate-binding protein n=1 Tax=Thiomicrorhabdus sp. zzn3 TaxID=3039775 RepID=UPI002436CB5D|nr:ABC transporter substrate-binding protein [Thiomicrorhabdus sp. zzn3]MDG6777426.1 ABC transporter substrate-binding protein [Thiomicrorhabdus sp. zzn3]